MGWIALALGFAGWVGVRFGRDAAEDFVTAWLVEKSLSLDNLFVFIVIFARLQIPKEEQRRVLIFGIVGALVTRAAFIACGSALLSAFHGVTYLLGALLVYTAVKTLGDHAKESEGDGRILTFLKRHLPFTPDLHGHRFTVVERGRRLGTPLLLALVVIELTDVAFAIDSIPAVFSISQTPFIVYGSNVFAALGLRALFIVLADLLADLKYLRFALAGILGFTGVKMLASSFVHVPHAASLLIISGILVAAIVPSVVSRRRSAGAPQQGVPMSRTAGDPP